MPWILLAWGIAWTAGYLLLWHLLIFAVSGLVFFVGAFLMARASRIA